MNYVTAGQCLDCCGELWPVNAGLSTRLVQARGRINAGGLGWIVLGPVVLRSGNAGRCTAVQGTATNRHRGRRGEASTPRGGMHQAWCGGLSLDMSRLGEVWQGGCYGW
jgi:hypothetical protein